MQDSGHRPPNGIDEFGRKAEHFEGCGHGPVVRLVADAVHPGAAPLAHEVVLRHVPLELHAGQVPVTGPRQQLGGRGGSIQGEGVNARGVWGDRFELRPFTTEEIRSRDIVMHLNYFKPLQFNYFRPLHLNF